VVALAVLAAAGMTGGCHFSLSYSLTNPERPPEELVPPAPPRPPAPEVIPAGAADGPPPMAGPEGAVPDAAPDAHDGPHGPVGMELSTAVPTELQKKTLPPYMIEPPDILLIDAVRLVPKPPYRIEALDVLIIQVGGTFPDQPIAGPYPVSPDGTVALGFNYGSVRVAGLTLEQAQAAIRKQLSTLKDPQVTVSLGQFRGLQQVRGEHLVRPDGTIHLGTYGCVYVTGMTLAQARWAVEQHLSQFLQDPEVAIDVFAYNSKSYYIIFDGAGFGQQVFRFPITGNETVLDAIGQVYGLPAVASKRRIWVARPAPAHHECLQILPVDWEAITEGGATRTNYQLFPGDRIFVKADKLIALDNALSKLIAPIERLFGVILLGNTTVQSFGNNGFNNGGFFFTGN
jgi:polysaccharide export outer membrane protein